MRHVIHLFQVLNTHGKLSLNPCRKPIIFFHPSESYFLSNYYATIKQEKIEAVTWLDLLRRTFIFSKAPSIKGHSFSVVLKILFIRCLYANAYNCCRDIATTDAILCKGHPKEFFVDGPHLMDVFRTHFPSFRIGVALTRHRRFRDALIRFIARTFHDVLLDCDSGISIFLNFDNETLLRTYRALHPNRKVIVRFCDTIEDQKIPALKALLSKLIAEKTIDQAESYFEQNANSLGIQYRPNSVCLEAIQSYRGDSCRYLYAFIGVSNANQSRLQEINTLKKEILSFYPCVSPYIREVIAQRVAHFIPYKDYLTILGSSEVIVDLYRRFPNEGFSFRTAEALALNKKVITNRTNIRTCWFYHPNRFFIIGYDALSRLKSFLENDCPPLSDSQLEQFTTDHLVY